MKTITFSMEISPDSMGQWDGRDLTEVAEEFAKFLTKKLEKTAACDDRINDLQVSIDVTVKNNIYSSLADITPDTGDIDRDIELLDIRDDYDSNDYWEEFCCDSPYALKQQ